MKPFIEVESKFLVPSKAAAIRLSQARELGGAKVGEPSHVALRDTYYDTQDGALKAAGWSYRLRTRGDRVEACLKAADEGGEVKRRECLELRYPPGSTDPASPPGELRGLLASLIAERPLEAVAVFSQERDCLPLFKDGAEVAELDIDRIRAGTGARAPTVTIVEVELTASGSPSDLEDIRSALESEYGLLPDERTKLDIALQFRGEASRSPRAAEAARKVPAVARDEEKPAAAPPEASEARRAEAPADAPSPPPAEPEASHGDEADEGSATLGMRELAERSIVRLSGAIGEGLADFERRGDPDSVHDVRVSARRMLAALDAFEGYLEAKAVRRAEKELKRLARAFGRLRDLDIIIADARARSNRLSERRRPGFDAFVADLDRCRSECLEKLRAKTDERRGKLDAALGSLAAAAGGDAAPVAAADAAPALALDAYALLRAEGLRLDSPPTDPEAYHSLRLQVKRLRYIFELLGSALGPASAGCVEELRRLQDKLGAMTDSAAAVLFLREYLAPSRRSPSPEVAAYLAIRQGEAERLLRSMPKLRKRIVEPAFRRKIMAAIAHSGEERT